MPSLSFEVPGTPQQQGSKTVGRSGDKVWLRESNQNLRPWRAEFIDRARAAKSVESKRAAVASPASLYVRFYFQRPQGHYGTGRNAGRLKPSAPTYKTSKPDVDKLLRAVLDGLEQAGVLRNDALAADVQAVKRYGDRPYTEVHLSW